MLLIMALSSASTTIQPTPLARACSARAPGARGCVGLATLPFMVEWLGRVTMRRRACSARAPGARVCVGLATPPYMAQWLERTTALKALGFSGKVGGWPDSLKEM